MEDSLSQQLQSNNNNIEKIKYNFPKGTIYEKELRTNFRYFNIFWYDPNGTNDFDFFKNCFINVRLVKGTNLESVINFFKKELSTDEWIVITPGSKGEELIKNLEKIQCIYAFFIYCKKTELYENLSKQISKVKCVTSNPEILCKKFIEINKEYLFPNFKYNYSYEENDYDDYINLWNLKKLESENKFALNSIEREIKIATQNLNKTKNKYNNFCIKAIKYLSNENCIKDFKEPVEDENSILYLYVRLFKTKTDEQIKQTIKFVINNILLSLYFNQYKYYINLLAYEEVKEIIDKEINMDNFNKMLKKTEKIVEELKQKIMNNESIIELKEELKEVQKYYITFYFINIINTKKFDIIKFYEVINFLRDFGFCSKILVYCDYSHLNNKNYKFYEEILLCLSGDISFINFQNYMVNVDPTWKGLNFENLQKINNTLLIKDFLIIGNEEFIKKIKLIEKDLKVNSIKYIQINQIRDYLSEKNKKDKLRVFFYFLIITYDEFKNDLEKIIILSAEFGVTFLILLYIENSENNMLIPKYYINNNRLLYIILVYSTEDILRFFEAKLDLKFINITNDVIDMLKNNNEVTEKKVLNNDNDEDEDYQDGCFELAETFNFNLVKNKTVFIFNDEIDFKDSISENIYNIYKQHNALDLFFNQNIKYSGFQLYIGIIFLDICFIKMILYMYCREEKEHEKSFYRIINEDLRTKDPSKIDRLIILLGHIYKLIENKELASFKGKVYRATKLDENLILKLKEGTKMINITFWSTSKNYNVAKKFMANNNWRNAYIICKTVKTNVDIDYEKLNPFNEYEVLILPFTEFKIEKIYSENKFGRKIYIIELIELGNKNLVNYDNMNVKEVGDFVITNLIEKKVQEKEKNL